MQLRHEPNQFQQTVYRNYSNAPESRALMKICELLEDQGRIDPDVRDDDELGFVTDQTPLSVALFAYLNIGYSDDARRDLVTLMTRALLLAHQKQAINAASMYESHYDWDQLLPRLNEYVVTSRRIDKDELPELIVDALDLDRTLVVQPIVRSHAGAAVVGAVTP